MLVSCASFVQSCGLSIHTVSCAPGNVDKMFKKLYMLHWSWCQLKSHKENTQKCPNEQTSSVVQSNKYSLKSSKALENTHTLWILWMKTEKVHLSYSNNNEQKKSVIMIIIASHK